MKLKEICKGLKDLLLKNHYSPATIVFYEREWRKIQEYLFNEHNTDEFTMELGLKYLEFQYQFVSQYKAGEVNQQRVQLLRIVHMLEDYKLHGVLINRYGASKNSIKLTKDFDALILSFISCMNTTELSNSTKKHYKQITIIFLDFLQQKDITNISDVNYQICTKFIKTLSQYSYKTIEQYICGLRYFLRYLLSTGCVKEDIANRIHMAPMSKTASIPSVWTQEELKKLLEVIDRNNPMGKRNYAMILLACVLGIRIGDIKRLTFNNFSWENKTISFIQHKTHKAITLPLPEPVGWAIIDYIKNGRPEYFDTPIVFIKHMPPFSPFSEDSSVSEIIRKYMNKAGIRLDKGRKSGFHSLRHTAASMMLEEETQLPVISTILGHTSFDTTAIYLKTDLSKLKECVLSLEFEDDFEFHIQ